ncbi:hypothetical protein ILUMI_17876, partial [Ignelater luminosus]
MFGSSWMNNFSRLFRIGKLRNDDIIFRLATSLTSGVILCAISILLTSKIWGDNITCMVGTSFKDKFLDTYCWVHSTYSVDVAFKKKVGRDTIYPGIMNSRNRENSKRYHKYYQWTPFVLLCQ